MLTHLFQLLDVLYLCIQITNYFLRLVCFWFYGTVACRVFIDDPKVDTKERWALENVNEKTRICHACFDTYSTVKGSLDLVSAEGAQLSFRPATDVCFY